MKQYVSPNQLRLVGKGWEIRHQLRKLSSRRDNRSTLLADYTGGTKHSRALSNLRLLDRV